MRDIESKVRAALRHNLDPVEAAGDTHAVRQKAVRQRWAYLSAGAAAVVVAVAVIASGLVDSGVTPTDRSNTDFPVVDQSGNKTTMPIAFLDGTVVELHYPTDLGLHTLEISSSASLVGHGDPFERASGPVTLDRQRGIIAENDPVTETYGGSLLWRGEVVGSEGSLGFAFGHWLMTGDAIAQLAPGDARQIARNLVGVETATGFLYLRPSRELHVQEAGTLGGSEISIGGDILMRPGCPRVAGGTEERIGAVAARRFDSGDADPDTWIWCAPPDDRATFEVTAEDDRVTQLVAGLTVADDAARANPTFARYLVDLGNGFEGSEDPLTTTGVVEVDAEDASVCLETALLGVRSAHLHRRDGTASIDLVIEENNRPEPICTNVPRAPLLDVIEHQPDWYIEFHNLAGATLAAELQPLSDPTPDRPSTGALNDQLWDGDVSFRLLRVDCSHGPAGDENTDSLRAEGNHCFVGFGVVNESDENVTLPANLQFLYAGPGGTRFLPWQEGMREFVLDDAHNAFETPIPPGGGAVDQVVFDAPIDHFPSKVELHATEGSPGVTFHLSGCSFIDYKGKVSGGCYPGRMPARFGVPYAHRIGTESGPGSPYLQRTCFNGLEWSIPDRDPEDVPEGFLGMGTMTLIAEDLARFHDNSGQVYELRPTEDNEGDPGLCG